MSTPKKIVIQDLELADEEIARLRKENKKLKKYYDRDKEELMESCYALKKENDKLQDKLEEVTKDLIEYHEEYKNMADMVVKLLKEKKNLKLIIEDNEKQMKLYMEDRDNLREEVKKRKMVADEN